MCYAAGLFMLRRPLGWRNGGWESGSLGRSKAISRSQGWRNGHNEMARLTPDVRKHTLLYRLLSDERHALLRWIATIGVPC